MRGWSLQTAKKVSEPVKVDKVIKKVAKKKKSKK